MKRGSRSKRGLAKFERRVREAIIMFVKEEKPRPWFSGSRPKSHVPGARKK